MTLKMETSVSGANTVIRLSGRLRSDDLHQLKAQFKGDWSQMQLDFEGVTLVDVEVVRFLNACAAAGIELVHCSPYIREWMTREKDSAT